MEYARDASRPGAGHHHQLFALQLMKGRFELYGWIIDSGMIDDTNDIIIIEALIKQSIYNKFEELRSRTW